MTEQLTNIDKSLLSYLQNTYKIEYESTLYKVAKLLINRLWQGSICVSYNDLKSEIHVLEKEHLIKSLAIGKGNEIRPMVFDGDNLYIQRYYIYQKRILEKIEILCKNNNFHIITGGPGTGKTTSLAKELAIKLSEKNNEGMEKKILLAAPTGKAAFRMKEALKNSIIYDEKKEHTHWVNDVTDKDILGKIKTIETITIHRLLGTNHLSVNFKHNKENPLDADLIVIDECSMVDLPMMAKLLDAIPYNNCDLYLLGDKNQLASIEAGSVFADICKKFENNKIVYTELTINHRSKDAEGIEELSRNILNNNVDKFENTNVHHFENISMNKMISNYSKLFHAKNAEEALDSLNDYQILCATKEGITGTKYINKELLKMAKKNKVKFTPIIITENNYALKLFNGDVGVKDEENAYFLGDDGVRQNLLLTLPDYDDAFAITIHKSQGSEYNCVAVVYPNAERDDDDNTIFTRELLYTAITRARKECLIYGSPDVLLKSCERRIHRASGI